MNDSCLLWFILITLGIVVVSGPATLIAGLVIGGINKWSRGDWMTLVIFGSGTTGSVLFAVLLTVCLEHSKKQQQPQQEQQQQEHEEPVAIPVDASEPEEPEEPVTISGEHNTEEVLAEP